MGISSPFVTRRRYRRDVEKVQEVAVEIYARLRESRDRLEGVKASRDEALAKVEWLEGVVHYLRNYSHRLGYLNTEELREEIRRRDELIRWLARPFADNDPTFPKVDPMTGTELPGNAELERTWREVVRQQVSGDHPGEEREPGEMPPAPQPEG